MFVPGDGYSEVACDVVAEEAAFAYKDIETAMVASATLVRPTKRLTPLGVAKG
jgi:RNA-splicing ligase RtcB